MSFNRVNATFSHEEPDRVPVTDLDVNWGVLAKATRHILSSTADYATDLCMPIPRQRVGNPDGSMRTPTWANGEI